MKRLRILVVLCVGLVLAISSASVFADHHHGGGNDCQTSGGGYYGSSSQCFSQRHFEGRVVSLKAGTMWVKTTRYWAQMVSVSLSSRTLILGVEGKPSTIALGDNVDIRASVSPAGAYFALRVQIVHRAAEPTTTASPGSDGEGSPSGTPTPTPTSGYYGGSGGDG